VFLRSHAPICLIIMTTVIAAAAVGVALVVVVVVTVTVINKLSVFRFFSVLT